MPETSATAPADPIELRDEAPYRVSSIGRVTPSIVEVWLHPLAEPMEFLPGEYVLLEDSDHRVPPRSYSIANAPRPDGDISLLVTRVAEGATSSWVHDRLCTGDEVVLTGPYGRFVADPSSGSPCLCLAAGSGFAPIRALIEASLRATPGQSLTVVLSARTEADVLDREQLLGWRAAHPQFRFITALTREGPRRRVPELLPEICPGSPATKCSWQARRGSCSPAPRPPRRSAPSASTSAPSRSSSNRSH